MTDGEYENMKSSNIGGQAVMEGIMMRHKDKYSIAVRVLMEAAPAPVRDEEPEFFQSHHKID